MIRILIAFLIATAPLSDALAQATDPLQSNSDDTRVVIPQAAETDQSSDCDTLIQKRASGAQLSRTEATLLSFCFSMLPPLLAPPDGVSTAYQPPWVLRGDPENILAGPSGYTYREGI